MRELLRDYMEGHLSRRSFFQRLVATGFTATAASSVIRAAESGEQEVDDGVGSSFYTQSGTGADLLCEQIKAAGTRYIFTNPGSVEAGFFDALTDRDDLHLVMGLHEGVVIAMADGYHKATLKPAFVNVHTVAGTAQATGQLYNAHRLRSALVVTAGFGGLTKLRRPHPAGRFTLLLVAKLSAAR